MSTKNPLDLTNLLTETEVTTSAKASTPIEGSAQVSVRLDGVRYSKLKKIGQATGMSHKEILTEGFDLWVKANGYI